MIIERSFDPDELEAHPPLCIGRTWVDYGLNTKISNSAHQYDLLYECRRPRKRITTWLQCRIFRTEDTCIEGDCSPVPAFYVDKDEINKSLIYVARAYRDAYGDGVNIVGRTRHIAGQRRKRKLWGGQLNRAITHRLGGRVL